MGIVLLASVLPTKVHAIAPGCTASNPTALTGTIKGHLGDFHDYSINALVGMDLLANNVKVDLSNPNDGYSYVDRVNASLPQPGAPQSVTGWDRNWGASLTDGNGVLCIPAAIDEAWFEVYPRSEVTNLTDKTYYGNAAEQNFTITPGVTNNITLRLPTNNTYGGDAGKINGYITYNGQPINMTNEDDFKVRVWPTSPGSACGVQGYAGDADYYAYSQSENATYYRVDSMAAGQCGAAYQRYQIHYKCWNVCGNSSSAPITIIKYVNLADGAGPRIDVDF